MVWTTTFLEDMQISLLRCVKLKLLCFSLSEIYTVVDKIKLISKIPLIAYTRIFYILRECLLDKP